jgi:hypothetical protein
MRTRPGVAARTRGRRGFGVVRLDPAIAFPDASPRAFLNADEPRDLR